MRRLAPAIILLAALLTWSCQGDLDTDAGDAGQVDSDADTGGADLGDAQPGDTSASDTGNDTSASDTGNDTRVADVASGDTSSDTDTGTATPCQGVTCGANAHCDNGQCVCEQGYGGDPSTGCQPVTGDPCSAVSCDHGATCVGGTCVCDPGFSGDGAGGCSADPVSAPDGRTRQEVCDRWNGYTAGANTMWQVEPADACDWGVVNPQVRRDALRRLTLFRWLSGLGPVASNMGYVEVTQACATTLAAEGAGLTHQIPDTYACYTTEAAQGAGSSNLAYGVATPAASIDLYIGDRGVASLGHRRWALNPSMRATDFGQRGSYSCMYAFDRSGQSSVDHILYPSAGYFPRQALLGSWSAGSTSFGFGSSPSVTVTRVDDGSTVDVQAVSTLPQGYGPNTISWQVPDAQADVPYQITISNGSESLSYQTTLVDCH